MNISKRFLSMFLVLCMFIGLMPMTALAGDVASQADASAFIRVFHLDCGRKYFTVNEVKELIDAISEANYTHMELAFGNNGMRFLLDDMSVTVNGTTYSDADVTAGIQAGNQAYNVTKGYYPSVNELTETDMNAIIDYAKSKNIEIIPLLNTPGHMNALVTAMSRLDMTPKYLNSSSTIDLEDTAAVAFTKALVLKYALYFADKGCRYFNIGADEYANDIDNAGFAGLIAGERGEYGLFVDYVNALVGELCELNMTPIAFNDGIYYYGETGFGTFDKRLVIAYWTSGYPGYNPAPVEFLTERNHKVLYTNESWYYVLGRNSSGYYNYNTALDAAKNMSVNSGRSQDIGAMQCLWCDEPAASYDEDNKSRVMTLISTLSANNTKYFVAVEKEEAETVTKTDESTNISVAAPGLTGLTVAPVTENVPVVSGAAKVLAWDITPKIGEEEYSGSATVKLPVPSDWTPSLVKGFYVENDEVKPASGTYANGFYSFTMPHFSVGGIMLLDAATDYELVEINVGETHEIVIENVNYEDEYDNDNDPSIATVVVEYKAGDGTAETPATAVAVGESYYLKNDAGQYMNADAEFVDEISEAVKWRLNNHVWYDNDGVHYSLSYNSQHLYYDDWSGTGVWKTDDAGDAFTFQDGKLNNVYYANLSFVPVTAGGTVAQSTITFTGIASGTTYATVGDTTYKIVVIGKENITINYVANGTVIKTETVSVADNATTYTVSNFNHTNGKYYVVDSKTLAIDPKNTTVYTVNVTETTENLDGVAPLTIEYWQTNHRVNASETSSAQSLSVAALDAYSEAGLSLIDIVPAAGLQESAPVVYWRSRLLPRSTNEQTTSNGDDESLNGTGFTKIRYWNGDWAVYTDAGEWQAIVPANYQLVAYYMNDMDLANEVNVGTSDWGKKGDGTFADQPLEVGNSVSLSFQVIYEDGLTTVPATTAAADLASTTYLVNSWNPRGVGVITLTQIGDYQIGKITAETGTHVTEERTGGSVVVTKFDWGENDEMVVYEGDPVSHYTIVNPGNDPLQPGEEGYEPYYQNLTWENAGESILIRIYLKTVKTDDSLTVVYYDEKFNDTLYTYNISVENGTTFATGLVGATEFTGEAPEAGRLDVSKASIGNKLGETQYFQTDLTLVPEAVGKYRNDLYSYTGSKISEDGKTLYLYYNIDTEVLSPNFVVDFGLPFTFELEELLGEGTLVDDVTAVSGLSARYGTLTYNNGVFTYTPTKILQNIDVLSIALTINGKTNTTNVGVTPATTVYYEESFVNWNGWNIDRTSQTLAQATATQTTEILGSKQNNFGYDPAYAGKTGASNGTFATTKTLGASGQFTFTGTGVQVYANTTDASGYVGVQVKDAGGNIAAMAFVNTDIDGAATGASNKYGMPIVSLIDVNDLKHGTYTVDIVKILNSADVYIDGIRVIGTIEDSTVFNSDLEDNPIFYEMRDVVLTAIGINVDNPNTDADEDTSKVYDKLFDQVHKVTEDLSAVILDPTVSYENSNTVQDMLDNGPKNEIFLNKNQILAFNITTQRVLQIGLKAPQNSTTVSISTDGGENFTDVVVNSSVNMFYTLANRADNSTTYNVQIKNIGDAILSVTELKICDDPNAAFVPFTAEDIANILGVEVDEDIEDKEPEEDVKEEEPEEDEKVEIDFENDEWFWDMLNLVNSKFAIIAEAYEGGSISKEGVTYVKYYNRITYTITPDEGYEVESVIVDGEDVGAVRRYTFRQVKDDHTISVKFKAIDEAAE